MRAIYFLVKSICVFKGVAIAIVNDVKLAGYWLAILR